ncbi:DUF11 domain-containing protein [Candidatus Bathyarchaeota archaeon]|nr:MAG: DUF11 domain-containing protein [Candidatus Bathyarchaeota archaeon]
MKFGKAILFVPLILSTLALMLLPLNVRAHTIGCPSTVPLVMGRKNIPIGLVKVWNDADNLYVLFEINNGSYPNYAMKESHLDVSTTPLSWYAPGLWPYYHIYSPPKTYDLYVIPLSSIDGGVSSGTTIYLMAHATICKFSSRCGCCWKIGSAYGLKFKGSFNYVIQEVTPPASPELSIVKTGPSLGYPGGIYTYIIIISNVGNATAYNVNVTDTLPSGVVPAYPESPGTPTGIYNETKNTVNWIIGNIYIEGFMVITLEVRFNGALNPGATLTNTAQVVWEDEEGSSYGPLTATWDTTIIAGPKLSIEKTGPIISYPDSILVYTVTVSNIGNATAHNVVVEDTLPLEYVEYVSSTPEGTLSGNKVVWSLGSLNTGTNMLITLTVKVLDTTANGTQIVDHIEVTWKDSHGNSYGPETDEWVTTVFSNPLLNIVKSGPLHAHSNQIIEYTISVMNVGGSNASNVIVTDKLPNGITYISASPSPTIHDQTLNWSFDEITPGQTVTITISVNLTVYPEKYTCLTNNATVTWKDSLNRNYGPLWDAMTTQVCSEPLLEVEKTGNEKGEIGDTLSFNVTITNVGGCNATNVQIIDDLPYNLTLLSSMPSVSSYNHSTGRIIWNIDSPIEPEETIHLTLTVNVSDVKYDGILVFNNVYINWTDSSGKKYGPITAIHPVQLFLKPYAEVSKYGPLQVFYGGTATYTIELTNPTRSTLSGVTLTDYLPDGVEYNSSNPEGAYDISHIVTWTNIILAPGETKTFTVKVHFNSELPANVIIVDEAVAVWNTGSDNDIVLTEILKKTPTMPVGGKIIDAYNTHFSIATIVITVITIAVSLTIALKNRHVSKNKNDTVVKH